MKLNWETLLSEKTETDRSGKRQYDNRSPFDSDYSRITFSAPFRRLQDKTQVFPLEQNDYVRTRLTHSIEVASLARSLGKSISNELDKHENEYGWKKEYGNDICVLLECAGLVHDIGNPPFGHSSEQAIQNWFKKKTDVLGKYLIPQDQKDNEINNCVRIQDFLNYDGNVQGFRILTHLQCIKDYYGYHLTSALLATSMKYPFNSVVGNQDNGIHVYDKFGYFDSECKSAEFALQNCGLIDEDGKHYRHPLTFILEAADDIAYSAADIEDGYKKGLFTFEELLNELKSKKDDECVKEVLKNIEGYSQLKGERKIQQLRILIHQVYCDKVVKEFVDNYSKIMNCSYTNELLMGEKLKTLRTLLKQFSKKYLISNQEVAKLEIAGKNVISFLLDEFTTELVEDEICKIDSEKIELNKLFESLNSRKTWSLISEDFKDIYQNTLNNLSSSGSANRIDVIYYTYLLITDFISCMTDSYCIRLYRRLMGIDID